MGGNMSGAVKKIEKMSIQEVYISSPFGMISSLFYGAAQSALFTLLAVYAAGMNFTIFQIYCFFEHFS